MPLQMFNVFIIQGTGIFKLVFLKKIYIICERIADAGLRFINLLI